MPDPVRHDFFYILLAVVIKFIAIKWLYYGKALSSDRDHSRGSMA